MLRKRLLAYAFERDLMHPEDCGTMTHWYSRTPLDFLRAKTPKLLSQNSGIYSEQTGLVWDIADDANLDNYFALTAAHIREYGQAGLFHTIGLAERTYSDDREANLRLKKYVYRRICRYIQENYPGSRLLLASWDLYFTYTNDEVRRLLAELDREQVILFDYTSDSQTENSVLNWDVMGRFPWIFGIFQAYEPNSEIRNDYAFIERVMEKAKRDPALRRLRSLARAVACRHVHARIRRRQRVGGRGDRRAPLRGGLLPPPLRRAERGDAARAAGDAGRLRRLCLERGRRRQAEDRPVFQHLRPFRVHRGRVRRPLRRPDRASGKDAGLRAGLERALEKIDLTDERVRRDVWDIRRTLLGRRISLTILQIRRAYLAGEAFDALCESCLEQTEALQRLLAAHSDYSLRASLERLKTVAPVNPLFERTLKENANNMYCRSYIAELAADVYLPEQRLLFEALRTHSGTLDFRALCKADAAEISERFFAKLLDS